MIEWIKNLRKTERGRTAFKFTIYMIFLGFVLIILFLGGSFNRKPANTKRVGSTESSESVETIELTYFDKQNKLLNGNYEFKYTINGENSVLFDGELKDGVIKGYKESLDEVIKYEIEDGIVYKVFFNQKEEIHNLYENLDERLFDFSTLFELLNSSNSVIDNTSLNKIYKYASVYEYNIEVITNETEITKIIIKNENIEYNFEFIY